MPITDPLVLPADVVLAPVGELPAAVRRRFSCGDGDFALTRPRLRAGSRIVDAQAAALLAEFRRPSTVAEALIRHCRQCGLEPLPALVEAAYPLLASLLDAGFLVSGGAAQADGLEPTTRVGEAVAGFEVLRCVQELDDVEVYQVRQVRSGGPAGPLGARFAALKIERRAGAGRCAAAMAREAAVLERLAGEAAPRLVAAGVLAGRHYLVSEWCSGIDAAAAAAELRASGEWRGLLALAAGVARAYAGLHEAGVIHGDVHPRNALVAAGGGIRLLDFGLARCVDARGRLPAPARGAVPCFFEPEYARRARAGRRPPPVSRAGEQHAVAALLYLLLTGFHYRDFSLEREALLRQIAEEPPLPFAERGVAAWPEMESVLGRALAKRPRDRFRSLAALARALAAVRAPRRRAATPGPRAGERATSQARGGAAAPRRGGRPAAAADVLLAAVLARLGPEAAVAAGAAAGKDAGASTGALGAGAEAGATGQPRASLSNGAAGVACALYRIALAREDAALLAQADLWAARATDAARRHGDAAFYDPRTGITKARVGRVSPYHAASGTHAVAALIAHAQGDTAAQQAAIDAFLAAVRAPCAAADLTLGRSGVLLAAALLLDAAESGGLPGATLAALRQLGRRRLAGLWRQLDALPPAAAGHVNLGIAHGWGGWLYASLRWCRAEATQLPPRLAERLGELAGCAESWQRGLCWRWYGAASERPSQSPSMPGWCNGSAGFVHLWTLAHRQLGEPRYAALAEGAAWNAWEDHGGGESLCCGLAGRAYAMLELYRHGGGGVWLVRARALAALAANAARASTRPDSLYRGALGVAVLAADLARPRDAVMPFFAEEGWRTPGVGTLPGSAHPGLT